MRRICTFLLLAPLFFLAACYYDNEERLYPKLEEQGNCDLANVSYAAHIKPILESRCLSCHSSSIANSLGAGIRLENYNDLKVYATNGRLVGSVAHQPGYTAMPLGTARMDDCSVNKIKAWVEKGAPND